MIHCLITRDNMWLAAWPWTFFSLHPMANPCRSRCWNFCRALRPTPCARKPRTAPAWRMTRPSKARGRCYGWCNGGCNVFHNGEDGEIPSENMDVLNLLIDWLSFEESLVVVQRTSYGQTFFNGMMIPSYMEIFWVTFYVGIVDLFKAGTIWTQYGVFV